MPIRPFLILVLLWAACFRPLILHPGQVLYAPFADFLSEHLPVKLFLNREIRETGELPLWNTYHFCGTPVLHDIQVGVFYPPYAVMYVVPGWAVGAALSWVTALHVLAAGVFTLLYARSHELGEVGSLVAAGGYMLSAKWITHLLLSGHTVTMGLAWLPLVLLGLERGIRTGRAWPVIGAGAALAMLVLGTHPQWAFYAGVFAAVWTLAVVEWSPQRCLPSQGTGMGVRFALARWLACGLGAVVVAVLLAAVQLLPTWEAAGQSTRTAGLAGSLSLTTGRAVFLGLIGPSLHYDPTRSSEMRGLFAVSWLAAALAAPLLARGARWQAGVLLGMLAFSFGAAVLIEWLPGFRLFRIPARMLLIATFPLAVLAGTTTDAMIRTGWNADSRRALGRALLVVGLAAVLPTGLGLVMASRQAPDRPVWGSFVAYWVVVAISVPVLVWLVAAKNLNPRVRTGCWLVVLLAELLAPTVAFPAVRPQSEIYPESTLVHYLAEHTRPGEARVMDVDVGGGESDKLAVLGVGSPLALVDGIETVRGYNPLDIRHYREFIAFVVNDPSPVLGLSPVAQPIIPNFEIVNRALFDLMNVRYIVTAAAHPTGALAWDPSPPLVPAIPPAPPPHLPPFAVYGHHSAFPRAFVVPEAAPMPQGKELDALKTCDFRQTVLLTTAEPLPPNGSAPYRPARITEYRPNRVRIELDGRGGFLVLGDVWFPGWVCRVDGNQVPLFRANHAFRAVAVPPGAREAVFTFEPRSYCLGRWVSGASLLALGMLAVWAVIRKASR